VNGQTIAENARAGKIPYTIIELKEKIVAQLLEEGEPVYGGTGADPEVLKNAAVDKAKLVVIGVRDPAAAEAITIAVRKLNAHAHIIVRSQFVEEVETLLKLGADEVINERKEAAKRISESTLMQFN